MPKYNIYVTSTDEYVFEFECDSLDDSEVIEAATEFLMENNLSEIGDWRDGSSDVWQAELQGENKEEVLL